MTAINERTFAERLQDEREWTVVVEHAGHARSELLYFLVCKTPVGVLQATIKRRASSRDNIDTTVICEQFMPVGDVAWRFIASLGYRECGSRDLSPVREPALAVLRDDAERVVMRGLLVLLAYSEVE
jgi:hypothetical protein